jgi:hypothetical protein
MGTISVKHSSTEDGYCCACCRSLNIDEPPIDLWEMAIETLRPRAHDARQWYEMRPGDVVLLCRRCKNELVTVPDDRIQAPPSQDVRGSFP